ncbi:MAG: DUF2007 domain-containing protein [Chloroflexota bacterium]
MNRDREMVAVYKSASEMEAQVIKGLLDSFGIPCLLKSNAAPSVHMFAVDGLGEVRVMVWPEAAQMARELIEGEGHV